jgi:hypothetical protein
MVVLTKIPESDARTLPKVVKIQDGARHGKYVRDGTVYEAIAIPWDSDISFGNLGCVYHGWLVVTSFGHCHLFARSGYLAEDYIIEHLGIKSTLDAQNITRLIRCLTGRETDLDDAGAVWEG